MTTTQSQRIAPNSAVDYAGHTWQVAAVRGKGMCPPYFDLVRYDEHGHRRVELGVSYRIVGEAEAVRGA